jgi:2,4-dienoyl-CoA reductase-like NADH-dependent reductase (Old Yellow Enzyme family)
MFEAGEIGGMRLKNRFFGGPCKSFSCPDVESSTRVAGKDYRHRPMGNTDYWKGLYFDSTGGL